MDWLNLAQAHRLQAARLGPRPALRHRRDGVYRDVPWDRYRAQVEAAALALIDAGVRPGERVALLGENSVDWLVADLAILSAGAVAVTPHAPLTARQVHYQLHDSDCVWAIVSSAEQRDKVAEVRGELPALRGVVAFAGADDTAAPWLAFQQAGRRAALRLGGELRAREGQIGPDDLATVMYTSGTTGNPKGVMLTHGNLLSNAAASLDLQPHGPDDVVLSWLPYTHIYARTVDHYASLVGGVVLALAGCADTLLADLADVQPTNLAAVPRFYEKVLAAVASPDPAETGRRLRRVFGPRMDWMSAGGAPLPLPVAEAYHAAGLLLFQGYGLTETSPVISFNHKSANKLGTVGRPLPGVEVRLGPDGEVLTRGPHVMRGYWKNPGATSETIREGWLHTGDLGSLDADGFLSITGRKKELLVLSNGKKVAPSNLECLLLSDPCIDQAVVTGEGRNFLSALIVPHWPNVRAALAAHPDLPSAAEALAADHRVHTLVGERIRRALHDLSHMEQIKKFVVLPRPFSIEADEVTVSLKLRREVILAHNAAPLEALYHEPG